MLNGRIYRAAFLPLLLALAIAGFSLSDTPAPLSSNLAPDAFDGPRTVAELKSLSERFSDVRPGSIGDRELAAHVAGELRALGAGSGGGFTVSSHSFTAQTIEGERTLTTVLAQRPGSTGESPIAIVAHRDAGAGRAGSDSNELSATAVLLELARVLAASQTNRSIVLVSTSGGSGGNAGARNFAAHAAQWTGGPIDATIVVGDLAGAGAPTLASFAATPGSAPVVLQRTVAQALAQQAALTPATPTLLDTLAQLTFPLVAGEQAPIAARGIPAVLLQGAGGQSAGGQGAGGELPAPPGAPLSAARLEGLGRAVLAAVYALDAGPEVTGAGGSAGLERALPIHRKLLPEWAVRLLVAALLLPPLLTVGDGLARLRRRRPRTERSLRRWIAWVAACGLPFLACAAFALLLGWLGALAAPYPPVAPAAAPLRGSALEAVLAVALAFVLAWLTWPALMRRLRLPSRLAAEAGAAAGTTVARGAAGTGTGAGAPDAAPLALLLVLGILAAVVWVLDPYTALLALAALHLWLLLVDPERPVARSPVARLALVALGAAPLGLLIAFYAQRFGLGLGDVAHTAVLLLAGGRVGLAGAVLWSLALGCLAAALLIALAPPRATLLSGPNGSDEDDAESPSFAIRGPMSYAGPGSLGGTESALRR